MRRVCLRLLVLPVLLIINESPAKENEDPPVLFSFGLSFSLSEQPFALSELSFAPPGRLLFFPSSLSRFPGRLSFFTGRLSYYLGCNRVIETMNRESPLARARFYHLPGLGSPGSCTFLSFARVGQPWLAHVFSVCQGWAALAPARFFRLPGLCSPGWCAFLPFARVVWSWLVRVSAVCQGWAALADALFYHFSGLRSPGSCTFFPFARVCVPGWCTFLLFIRDSRHWLDDFSAGCQGHAVLTRAHFYRLPGICTTLADARFCCLSGACEKSPLSRCRCCTRTESCVFFEQTAPPSPFPAALRLFSTNDAADLCAHFAFLHHRGLFDPFFLSSLTEK